MPGSPPGHPGDRGPEPACLPAWAQRHPVSWAPPALASGGDASQDGSENLCPGGPGSHSVFCASVRLLGRKYDVEGFPIRLRFPGAVAGVEIAKNKVAGGCWPRTAPRELRPAPLFGPRVLAQCQEVTGWRR